MISFIRGLNRTIPKMGTRNFHLLFISISNVNCRLFDDLIWFLHQTWQLKLEHLDVSYPFLLDKCQMPSSPCPPTTPSAVSASRSAAPCAKAPCQDDPQPPQWPSKPLNDPRSPSMTLEAPQVCHPKKLVWPSQKRLPDNLSPPDFFSLGGLSHKNVANKERYSKLSKLKKKVLALQGF